MQVLALKPSANVSVGKKHCLGGNRGYCVYQSRTRSTLLQHGHTLPPPPLLKTQFIYTAPSYHAVLQHNTVYELFILFCQHTHAPLCRFQLFRKVKASACLDKTSLLASAKVMENTASSTGLCICTLSVAFRLKKKKLFA